MMKKHLFLLAAAWAAFTLALPATPIALEQFDYTGSSSLTGNGSAGSGWAGAWYDTGSSWWVPNSGSLPPSPETLLPVAGNQTVSSGARSLRQLSTVYDDTVTQTLYLSFLFDEANTADAYKALELFNGGNDDNLNRTFQLGALSGNSPDNTAIYCRINNDDALRASLGTRTEGTAFYLIQVDFDATGDDTVQIWRNPGNTPGAADATLNVPSLGFDRIALASFGGSDLAIDEIRFGTVLEDVLNTTPPVYPIEQFDYSVPVGEDFVTLEGRGSAADGWAGAWYNANPASFPWALRSDGSLAPTVETITPVAGLRVVCANNRAFRNFAVGYNDAFTSTLYLGLLVNEVGIGLSAYKTFEFFNGGTSDSSNRVLQVGALAGDGNNSLQVQARLFNDSGSITSMGTRSTAIEFYLVQIDFVSGGDDTIQIWRNPGTTPGAADVTFTTPSFAFDRIALASYGGSDLQVDEIRMGDSIEDVLASAEPGPVYPEITPTATGLRIAFDSTNGVTYTLETSPDLGVTPWADAGEAPIVGDGGPQEFLLEPAPALPAFFQIRY